jgi:hypothetical protein
MLALLALFLLSSVQAQAQTPMPVNGSGTTNRVPKWTGTNTLGNSAITESGGLVGINTASPQRELHIGNGVIRVDRSTDTASLILHRTGRKAFMLGVNSTGFNRGEFVVSDLGATTTGAGTRRLTIDNTGNVGIGVDVPAHKLSVAGVIYSTAGGFRFPDGTVQTTAATGGIGGLTSVIHDVTLAGSGTSASPLRVAVPLTLSGTGSDGSTLSVDGNGDHTAITATGGRSYGIYATAPNGFAAVYGGTGQSNELIYGALAGMDAFGNRVGVEAFNPNGKAVYGIGGTGVYGETASGLAGVYGYTEAGSSVGVYAANTGGLALLAVSTEVGARRAAQFDGNVTVNGNLSKSGGSFKIDHPLDPQNKYLSHSFVESPDMMNIYNGNAVLDGAGEAVVELPEWFGALNRDFRYQLTAMGAPGPNLYIAEEVADNRFKIAGGEPGMKVSWQVTGVRKDAWAEKHRIPVEEEKPKNERGHYLHPELYDQPEEKGVNWAQRPEMMKRLKAEREQREAARQP